MIKTPNAFLPLSAGLLLSLASAACAPPPEGEELENEEIAPPVTFALTGNGAPSGSHFTLNLIGASKEKAASFTGGNGSRMFVPLSGSAKIMLSEGPFSVLDANATDGTGSFQLPNPDPENDGTTTYSVFARALGKPGGSSKTTTCATDSTGETYCSVYSAVAVRESGRSRFENVSKSLLYVYADVDGDGAVERYNIFNEALKDYYWQYDNQGLKVLQLRFYETSTTVP
ncbi:MAG TPA: hypothetical protein VGG33_15755 [Polyangia bacterium]